MKHILYFLFVSPLAFSFESSDNCDDIDLFFLSPQDGFVSENQKQDNCKVSGHHHLIINNAYEVKSFENQPIPYGANILHFGGGQKEAELSLPPGKYSLQLAIGDYEHKPINRNKSDQKYDPILSEIINVEILP